MDTFKGRQLSRFVIHTGHEKSDHLKKKIEVAEKIRREAGINFHGGRVLKV